MSRHPFSVLPGGGEGSPELDSVAVSAEGDEIVIRLRRGTVELGAAALNTHAARALAATLLVVAETAEGSPELDSVAVSAEGDEIVIRLRRGTIELGAAALNTHAARALAATLLVVAETAEAWGAAP